MNELYKKILNKLNDIKNSISFEKFSHINKEDFFGFESSLNSIKENFNIYFLKIINYFLYDLKNKYENSKTPISEKIKILISFINTFPNDDFQKNYINKFIQLKKDIIEKNIENKKIICKKIDNFLDKLKKDLKKINNLKQNINNLLNELNKFEQSKIILWEKSLSLLINTKEFFQLENKRKKFENKIDDKILTNSFFSELNNLFWIRFCNGIRDYIKIILKLLFKNYEKIEWIKENKCISIYKKFINYINKKYVFLWYIIDKSTILKFLFFGEYIGTHKAFSYTLHNYNFLSFEKEHIVLIENEYRNISNLLSKCNFEIFQKEIEQIYMFFLLVNNEYVKIDIPSIENIFNLNKINSFKLRMDNINVNKNFDLNNISLFNFLSFYNMFDFLDAMYEKIYGKDKNDSKW